VSLRAFARAAVVLALALALGIAACGKAAMPGSLGHPLEGVEAPRFSAESTVDGEVGIPGDERTAVTVVDFWASWCQGCRQTLPALDVLYREHKAEGVEIIGVCLDENEGDARALLESLDTSFPMVLDPNMRLARAYRAYSIPLTFVIDREGLVRWAGRDPARVREVVEVLLAEPRSEAR
jgi:peroxiredoxin